jgi:hypothetical protein
MTAPRQPEARPAGPAHDRLPVLTDIFVILDQ